MYIVCAQYELGWNSYAFACFALQIVTIPDPGWLLALFKEFNSPPPYILSL